ncbi:MAG TPA: hypothetical protein VFV50_16165, partial [Bdellovibrionales bacterium]|nr:hypothetical protein [Bdellovibrionales bacterium]
MNVYDSFVYTSGTVVTTGSHLYIHNGTQDRGVILNLGTVALNHMTVSRTGDPTAAVTITGTLTLNGNYVHNSDLKLNGGTLDVKGNVTFTSAGGGNAAITFSGAGAQTVSRTAGTLPSGTFTINKSAGVAVSLASNLSLNSAGQDFVVQSGTLDLAGRNLTVNDRFDFGSTTARVRLQGGETFTRGSFNQVNGSEVEYYGTGTYTSLALGNAYRDVYFTGTGTYQHNAAMTAESLTINAGATLNSAGNNLQVSDVWTNNGTYTSGANTFTMVNNATLNGSTTFNNFTLSTALASTLTIQAGSTQTIAGTLTLNGASGNLLSLRSSAAGTRFDINPQGTRTISYLDVRDSNNTNATAIDATGTNSTDSGNNVNWIFVSLGSFAINGATGGTDATADGWLGTTTTVTANWAASTGATGYDVAIRNAADTDYAEAGDAAGCAVSNTAATSYTFSGCTLSNGSTYLIKVTARANSTLLAASNNGYSFTVDTDAPAAFTVAGATGGTDSTANAYLTSGTDVTANWNDTTGETAYDVAIYRNDGTTVQCASVSKAADAVLHDFTADNCDVTEGQIYKIYARARDQAGNVTVATNSMYNFTVDSTPPAAFTITGVTGGADTSLDGYLTDGFEATANWNNTTGESAYDVTIFEDNGSTVKCALTSKAADVVLHAFAGCALSDNTQYKLRVVARDDAGNPREATNSLYAFLVAPAIEFTTRAQAVSESTASVTVTATLNRTSTLNVSASYTVTGSATPGSEHDFVSGTFNITAGLLTDSKTINLTNDALHEANETIVTTLSSPVNAGLGAKYVHGVIINDDDLGSMTRPKVVAGDGHTCVLTTTGRVKCWGLNSNGQLGYGTSAIGDDVADMGDALSAVNLGTGRTAKQLAVGQASACALLDNNQVKCWGANLYGELGLGDGLSRGSRPGEMGDSLPTVNLGTGRSAKAISAGDYHVCAILDNDSVKCWGRNNMGQLGLGASGARGDAAGEMGDSLPVVNLGTGRTAKAIDAGSTHTCAILDNDSVKCWGENDNGQLGYDDIANRGLLAGDMGDSLPYVNLGAGRTALAIGAGQAFSCALLDNSQVKCWGAGANGMTGYEAISNLGDQTGEMAALGYVNLGTGKTATAIYVNYHHSCAKLNDGTLKCWGNGAYGRLGLGSTANRGHSAGTMGDSLPAVSLGTGRSPAFVATGTNSTCARLDDNSLKCWGLNDYGKLGIGSTQTTGDDAGEMGDSLPAVNLGTGRTISATAVNPVGLGDTFSCAILDTGAVKCWGYRNNGVLGNENDYLGDAAGELASLPAVELGTGRTALDLVAGRHFNCALLDNQRVKCWGANDSGQLGVGDVSDRGNNPGEMGDALPYVELGTGRTVQRLAAGANFACALLDTNQIKCWGAGQYGRTGYESSSSKGTNPAQMGDALPAVNLGTGRLVSQIVIGGSYA